VVLIANRGIFGHPIILVCNEDFTPVLPMTTSRESRHSTLRATAKATIEIGPVSLGVPFIPTPHVCSSHSWCSSLYMPIDKFISETESQATFASKKLPRNIVPLAVRVSPAYLRLFLLLFSLEGIQTFVFSTARFGNVLRD